MVKDRDYKQEYIEYHGKPEQIKRRNARNAIRIDYTKKGLVKKGDKKDIHHIDNNPLNNNPNNLKILPRSVNRSIQ